MILRRGRMTTPARFSSTQQAQPADQSSQDVPAAASTVASPPPPDDEEISVGAQLLEVQNDGGEGSSGIIHQSGGPPSSQHNPDDDVGAGAPVPSEVAGDAPPVQPQTEINRVLVSQTAPQDSAVMSQGVSSASGSALQGSDRNSSVPLIRETYVSSSTSFAPREAEPAYVAYQPPAQFQARANVREDSIVRPPDTRSVDSRRGARGVDDADESSSVRSRAATRNDAVRTGNVGRGQQVTVSSSAPRRAATASDVGLRPDVYDGTGNFDTFRTRFQVVADANRWTEEERLFILPACLRGQALEAYSRWTNMGPLPNTSQGFLDALRDTFTDRRMERSASRRMFQSIRQDPGESMERFFIRFTTLADSAGVTNEDDLQEQWLAAVDPRVTGAIAGLDFTRFIDMAQRSVTAYNNLAFTRSTQERVTVANVESMARPQEVHTGNSSHEGMADVRARMSKLEAAMLRIEETLQRNQFGRQGYGRSYSPRRYDDHHSQRRYEGDRSRSPRRDEGVRENGYGGGYSGSRGGYHGQRRPSNESVGGGPHCARCGGRDHYASYCRMPDRVCFRCQQPGHDARDCPSSSAIQAGPEKADKIQQCSGN